MKQRKILHWHYDRQHDHLSVAFRDSNTAYCIGCAYGMDLFGEEDSELNDLTGVDFWDFVKSYNLRFSPNILDVGWDDLADVYGKIVNSIDSSET